MGNERSPLRPLALRAQPVRSSTPKANLTARHSTLEPTILLVGADTSFEPALRASLARHGVYVETSSPEEAANTVVVTAPDLVLLTGEAAADGGKQILQKLMSSSVTSVVPVAILDDNPALEMRLRAFRHGAAAVIPRSASIDAIAEQVAKLAREIPERGGDTLGVVGEATLSDFIDTLSKELRTGILSFYPSADKTQEPVRLVLGSGRPLAAFIDDFVRRVRRHVVHAEPLHYEFEEHLPGTVTMLGAQDAIALAQSTSIKGRRVALADDDAVRADGVAQELRSRGASVVITDLAPNEARFARLRQADPEILVISQQHVEGPGYELLRRMRRDTRLRWAALLIVSWDEIWSDALKVPACDRLDTALAALAEPERMLIERAEKREEFDTRLEMLGPARLLRAVTQASVPLRLTVYNPRLRVVIDVSDGLVVGATAELDAEPPEMWEGATALAALMVLGSGRVHVESVNQPATTNVMAPIDVALNMADSEPSPVSPSIPVTNSPVSNRASVISQPEIIPAPAAPVAASAPAPEPAVVEPQPVSAVDPFAKTAVANVEPTLVSVGGTAQPATASAPPTAPTTWTSKLATVADGLFRKPRLRGGVSRKTAIILISLAAVQGLIVAIIAATLLHKSQKPAPKAPPPKPSVVQLAPKPEPPKAPPSALSGGPINFAELDGAPKPAPTCDDLLSSTPLSSGMLPGAAWEQGQIANKALVRGNLEEAQRALCKAVRWDSKNAQRYLELAQLLLLRRDGPKTVEAANRALALEPGNKRALALLGDGLARSGDRDGAMKAWLAAASFVRPGDNEVEALSQRDLFEAEMSWRRNDVARAERFYRRVVVMKPENVTASAGLAGSLLLLGEAQPARRWAQRAVALGPKDTRAHLVLGDVLAQIGDKGGAEMEWQEAARLSPENREVQKRVRALAKAPNPG